MDQRQSTEPTRRSPFSLRTFALAVVAALVVSACGAGGTDQGGSTDDGTTDDGTTGAVADDGDALSVLVEGGGRLELEPIAAAWTEETGTEVNFLELPYGGLYDRLSSEFASGNTSFDVAALDAIWLTTFAEGVEPLNDLFTDDVRADLFDALVDEAQVDGQFVGMPVWTNAEILMYRTDLFEDQDEQQAFEAEYGYPLAPPTTWQEFTDVAAFFTRDTDGDGENDLYGTDVKGAVETEWLAHVLQAGAEGVVLDGEGNVIVDDQAHLEALEFYVSLLESSPPGAAQVDWAAAQNLFNQGETAMTRFWAHAYRQVPEDAAVAGNVGAAPMIAGDAGIAAIPGPWYLSVPTTTDKTDQAMDFVSFAYEHNALAIDTDLGLAARVSAYEEFAGQDGYESFDPLITTLSADATAPRPATPQWQEIVDAALIPMLQAAVEPDADLQALLADTKTQVEDIVD